MILLYTLLLLLLGLVKLLVSLRARALERKFVSVASAVEQMLREPAFKAGNSNKVDLCVSAKRTLTLGQLAQDRDGVEAKFLAWQRWADRLTNWVAAVREWQGKKLPYTFGAVDVWMLMSVIDYLGVGQYLSAVTLIQTLLAYWSE